MANKEVLLKAEILEWKKYIASEISTIDKLFDQMGYGRTPDDLDELNEKQEYLEQKHKELRDLETQLEESARLYFSINTLEDKVDTLQLITFKSEEIDKLNEEIQQLTLEREKILKEIETKIKNFDVNNQR